MVLVFIIVLIIRTSMLLEVELGNEFYFPLNV